MIPDNVHVGTADSELIPFFKTSTFNQFAVLVDNNSRKYCYPLVKDSLPEHFLIEIESGEEHKNLKTCELIWSAMSEKQMDRSGLIINLGGGVINDIGGFCASTYKRGISYLNLPTTLLSQVDASVGGKVGVDFNTLKNQIGLFNEPACAIIDSTFLKSLSLAHLRSGFAEILKHALIADNEYFEQLQDLKELDGVEWDPIIRRSLEIKTKITSGDPYESGPRKILNFGHSIGHAIESCLLRISKPCLHGEAIAIGILCEAFLSNKLGPLEGSSLERIQSCVNRHFAKNTDVSTLSSDQIEATLLQDKKNKDLQLKFTLLDTIGSASFDKDVSFEDVRESLDYYNSN